MRRRPFRTRTAGVLRLALALCGIAATVPAQSGVAREGAIFLLLPLGAGQSASGQSVANPEASSEQLFWNPAGAARIAAREIAFHHGSYFVGPLNAVAIVLPFDRAGILGFTVGILDYGSQETGDISGQAGTISQQSYVLSASYATPLGPRASFGVTYKLAKFVGNCSGLCPPVAVFDVSSSAVDLGVQYRVDGRGDFVAGVAVRHAGLRLQVNDEAQADPLPTRIQGGVSYRMRWLEPSVDSAKVRVSVDLIDRLLAPGDAAIRAGGTLTWRERVILRTGYVAGSGEGTGASVGFGVRSGRVNVDLGRILGGGANAGRGSTYLSLRSTW
jgi:hypothetical protein